MLLPTSSLISPLPRMTPLPNGCGRLRLAALRTQLRESVHRHPCRCHRLSHPSPTWNGSAAGGLDALAARDDLPEDAIFVARRDDRSAPFGPAFRRLSGLQPVERLGPFGTLGGIDVWFDIFLAARRMTSRERGGRSVIVLTQARPPVFRRGEHASTSSRGRCGCGRLLGAFPRARSWRQSHGGSADPRRRATIADHVVEVPAPFRGVAARPGDGRRRAGRWRCDAAATRVTLPPSITFTLVCGNWTVDAGPGTAEATARPSTLGPAAGRGPLSNGCGPQCWSTMWTPASSTQTLSATISRISRAWLRYGWRAGVAGSGDQPGAAWRGGGGRGWFLQLKRLLARWYDPELRFSEFLTHGWDYCRGVHAVADGIAALAPPVTHAYDLWQLSKATNGCRGGRRMATRSHSLPLRRDTGRALHGDGQAECRARPPGGTDGSPLPTQKGLGMVLLHRFDGEITASLAVLVQSGPVIHQFALRMRSIWTGAPLFLFARGSCCLATDRRRRASDRAGRLRLGPTLPDPYVANTFIRRPEQREVRRRGCVASVTWPVPDQPVVSFEGELGPGLALGKRDASAGEPGPPPTTQRPRSA